MEFKYKISTKLLIFVLLGAIMSCSSYLIFVYQPIHMLIQKMSTLSPGSIFLKLWETPPYNILVTVYVFNTTNPEAFLAGKEKLKFSQIGPYVYQETLMNTEPTFNENGTLTFKPKRFLKPRRDLSIGDPTVDRFISPNIPLLGITASLHDAGFFTNFAVAKISQALNSQAFLNITIDEYLYGYDDRLVSLAHQAIPSWINFERFGIMDRLMALDNATNVVTLDLEPERDSASPILTEEERHHKYHIQRWNGSPGLTKWGYDPDNAEKNSRCNMVEGSFDGTIFPPHLVENATVKMYRRAFCRAVPFHFKENRITKDGFDSFVMEIDQNYLDTPEENPDNSCYCFKGKCTKKGMGSLAPCYYDIPITISQPHFLNSDPSILAQFDGLNPDINLHNSNFTVHQEMGIALEANLKIQINLDIGQTRLNSITAPFNDKVLPLFWLELTLDELPTNVKFLMTFLFIVLPIVQKVLIYLLGLGGLALMSGSACFILFFGDQPNGRLSFRGDYSPIPIIPMNSPYFKPDIRISK